MTGRSRNVAASVRERLRRHTGPGTGGFLLVLQRYAIERLLYRLSESNRRDEFVLKGAVLLTLWGEGASRVTRDLDLLGHGPVSPEIVASRFKEILATRVVDDGLEYPPELVRAAEVLAGQEYVGVRLKLEARLERARIPMQVDVGFGDSVFPRPLLASFPCLLDSPAARIRVYPREAVIAEKFHAMVRHGVDNSRSKDFYDVFVLSQLFEFDGATLAESVLRTFRRRATEIPTEPPIALTAGWYADPARSLGWRKYLERDRLVGAPAELAQVGTRIRAFLGPLATSLSRGGAFTFVWSPGGSWK